MQKYIKKFEKVEKIAFSEYYRVKKTLFSFSECKKSQKNDFIWFSTSTKAKILKKSKNDNMQMRFLAKIP